MAHLFQGALHASVYSKFRPQPPATLINSVISFIKSKTSLPFGTAVDIGCGAGHSTVPFSPYFKNVIGLDVSVAQISNAEKERSSPNITYSVSLAEETPLAASSADLVTVGQALHWFDLEKFFNEVQRILVPNGVIAAYGYWIPTPTSDDSAQASELEHLIRHHLHDGVLGRYWDSRRINILKKHYDNIVFPFGSIIKETFVNRTVSTVSDYMGYLSSWSAFHTLKKEDEGKAEKLLHNVEKRLLEILKSKTSAEETLLPVVTDYFLVMGIKQ